MREKVRCANPLCGRLFERFTVRRLFCSKTCYQQHWKRVKANPDRIPPSFTCPYCNRTYPWKGVSRKTCGSIECIKAHEHACKKKKRERDRLEESKGTKLMRNGKKIIDITDHSGYCDCIFCGQSFWSPDMRTERLCSPKCKKGYQNRMKQTSYIPEGW